MKITVELTELDYVQYVRQTGRTAVAEMELERTKEALEELAGEILRAYVNPDGEPEKKVCNFSCIERAKELAEKVFEKNYSW